MEIPRLNLRVEIRFSRSNIETNAGFIFAQMDLLKSNFFWASDRAFYCNIRTLHKNPHNICIPLYIFDNPIFVCDSCIFWQILAFSISHFILRYNIIMCKLSIDINITNIITSIPLEAFFLGMEDDY